MTMKKQLYQVQKVNIIMYQLSFASMCVHCPFSVLKTFAPLAHPFFLKPVPPSFSPILPHAVLSLLPQGRILGSMAPWGPGPSTAVGVQWEKPHKIFGYSRIESSIMKTLFNKVFWIFTRQLIIIWLCQIRGVGSNFDSLGVHQFICHFIDCYIIL